MELDKGSTRTCLNESFTGIYIFSYVIYRRYRVYISLCYQIKLIEVCHRHASHVSL